MTPDTLLEVREYRGSGYRPLVDYGAWRVAVLRFDEELLPERIDAFQRHDETDEVFVLLEGRCILFLGEGSGCLERVHGEDMLPGKVYNVKKGAWHSHTLDQDALVLIVENVDTVDENSPLIALDEGQRREIAELTARLWKN